MGGSNLKELADILLESGLSDHDIPHLDLQLENIRILGFKGKKTEPVEDPTVERVVYGGDYQSGAIVSYEVSGNFLGSTTPAKYFAENLYPLLKEYHKQQDHTEILKHIAVIDHFDVGIRMNVTWSKIKTAFYDDACYCDITSDETKTDLKLPADIERRVRSVKVWTRPDENPFFTGRIIDQFMQGKTKFQTRFLKLAVDYDVPFSVPSDMRYVA